MKETHRFLIPDYFPQFSCKMGACRAACCEGWPVSVSMTDYFRLLGLDCAPELRSRLDCGIHVVDHPTKEAYARFEPRYDGNCPMRLPDGRCALHADLGEDVLPHVCRLYPRGVREEDGRFECSCANSCEAVLELFLDRAEPIAFVERDLTMQLPPLPSRRSFFETLGLAQKIRLHLIAVVQNRRLPLPQRLVCLGGLMDRLDVALKNRDKALLDQILTEDPAELRPQLAETEIGAEHLQFGLQIIEQMMEILDEGSQSIHDCGEAALAYFHGGEGDDIARYEAAKAHFSEAFPQWETFFEHMLVNHMFFAQFPFQDRPESMHEEFVALCAVYAILRFLALGCMADRRDAEGLIDDMAAAFRLVDHTEFDRYASRLLKRLGCASPQEICDLIAL